MKETNMMIRIGKICIGVPLLVILLAVLNTHAADEVADAPSFSGAPYSDGDLYADTWVATDALGRTQPGLAETGPAKKNRCSAYGLGANHPGFLF